MAKYFVSGQSSQSAQADEMNRYILQKDGTALSQNATPIYEHIHRTICYFKILSHTTCVELDYFILYNTLRDIKKQQRKF